jgi:hypothetical protein
VPPAHAEKEGFIESKKMSHHLWVLAMSDIMQAIDGKQVSFVKKIGKFWDFRLQRPRKPINQ